MAATARRIVIFESVLTIAALSMALSGCGKSPELINPLSAAPPVARGQAPLAQSGVVPPEKDVQCKTSATAVQTINVTEEDLGVSFYPGAKLISGNVVSNPEGTLAVASQQTTDPPDRVISFYRDRIVAKAEGRGLFDGADTNGHTVLALRAKVGKPGILINTSGTSGGAVINIATNCIINSATRLDPS